MIRQRTAPSAPRIASSRDRRRRLRELQVRHVRARDQQHHRHRAQQDQQRPLDVSHDRLAERSCGRRFLLADRVGIHLAEPLRRHAHLRLGGLERDAGLEPCRHGKEVALVGAGGIGLQGQVEVGGRIRAERGPQHAGHRVGLPVEHDRAADDGGIAAEPADPERMAHHREPRSAGPVLVRDEDAAERRAGVEDRKEVRRDVDRLHLLRRHAAAQVEARSREVVRAHRLERLRVLLPGHELGDRYAPADAVPELELQLHQPVRLAVGQRLQQNAVDHREDCGVGSDPEGEGRDRHGCEAGAAKKLPERQPDVLEQRVHEADSRTDAEIDRTCAMLGSH